MQTHPTTQQPPRPLTLQQEVDILKARIADAAYDCAAAEHRQDWRAADEHDMERQRLQRMLDQLIDDASMAIPRHQRFN